MTAGGFFFPWSLIVVLREGEMAVLDTGCCCCRVERLMAERSSKKLWMQGTGVSEQRMRDVVRVETRQEAEAGNEVEEGRNTRSEKGGKVRGRGQKREGAKRKRASERGERKGEREGAMYRRCGMGWVRWWRGKEREVREWYLPLWAVIGGNVGSFFRLFCGRPQIAQLSA